jgi:predicted amidohydrolase YtcJ
MQHADLIITTARIWDGHERDDEAIAVGEGRVVASGTNRDMLAMAATDTLVLDVEGRRLIPGLIDSHLHLVRAGRTWDREVRWDYRTSLADALADISAKAAELGPGRWVGVVGGWHPSQFEEGRAPTPSELDHAAPDNPVFVQRAYAEAFVNARAADGMGWSEHQAPDGRVAAPPEMAALRAHMAVDDLDEAMAGTRNLLRELNRLGLTGAIDASGFGITSASYDAFLRVFAEGDRGFRARLLLGAANPGREMEDMTRWSTTVSPGDGDDYVRYLGAGEVLDYAAHDLEGLEPKDITGRADALGEMSAFLAERGWPVHLHSILDASIAVVLDAWKEIGHDTLADLRFTICHADQIGEENLRRVRDLGVGITIQNGMSMRGLDCAPTWGSELVANAPPIRSMLDLGIPVAAGTDGTAACAYDPWRCIAWMITGESIDGAPPRSGQQRVSRDEALRLYTSAGARCSFEERTRGNLRPGSHADLAVLSEDPLVVAPERISSIESVLTVVGGEIVHSTLEAVPDRSGP